MPNNYLKIKILLILMLSFVPIYFVSLGFPTKVTKAESLDEIEKEIEKTKEELEKKDSELDGIKKRASEISEKLKTLSGNLNLTQAEINSLQNQINELSKDIENVNKKLDIKRDDLLVKEKIRNMAMRDLYITKQKHFITLLLDPSGFSNGIANAAYYSNFVGTSVSLIGSINQSIKQYESDRSYIESLKKDIEAQQVEMQKLAAKLAAQVLASKTDLTNVSQKESALQSEKNQIQKKLSELSSKQKALLEEKTGTFTTSVGDVPTTGDSNSSVNYDPAFRKAFAAFSFGAPHRKGMSQYGAKGRAEDGQDYKDILRAYYGDIEIKEVDIPSTINTDKGSMEIDGQYLNGLAEMPSNWPSEALKAQAVAARTYALSYIGWRVNSGGGGGKICTTENCQVWSSSKASSGSASNWHNAVSSTKKEIMISKDTGELFSAFYAATSGGYNYQYNSLGHNTSGGWDTKCGSKDCWTSDAYESKAGSPWFYKGWYKTRGGQSCGRTHPWLTEEEFADIVGAIVLYEKDQNNQTHLSQPDSSGCWDEDIEDTWSRDEVKEKSGINEVNSVSVNYSNGGYTSEVKVTTNKGDFTFSGEDFKAIFNLRAPGAIHLKSMLFNIEVKK